MIIKNRDYCLWLAWIMTYKMPGDVEPQIQ